MAIHWTTVLLLAAALFIAFVVAVGLRWMADSWRSIDL